jgi:hypothetical protein
MKGAYTLAEIDLNPAIGSPSYGDIREALFASNGKLLASPTNENYAKMLLPGYYGGSRRLANEGTVGKLFTPDDFKIGDAFIAAWDGGCATSGQMWVYITGIYVGDGQFVISESHTGSSCTEDCKRVYISDYNVENADKAVVWGNAEAMQVYRYYFVLRPERVAADALQSISLNKTELTLDYTAANSLPAANAETLTITKTPAAAADPVNVCWTTSNPDVATVVDGKITAVGAGTCTITVNCDGYVASCEVNITRSIEARTTLTATEQAAIAGFTTEADNTHWHVFSKNAYKAANITVDALTPAEDINDFNKLQKNLLSGKTVLEETDLNRPYLKMLVDGFYGGASAKTGKFFLPDEMEIGDILCTAYGFPADKCPGGSWRYVTAIYQGEGKFLVQIKCCTSGSCDRIYEDVLNSDGSAVVPDGYISLWSDAATLQSKFKYYFVLRPSQLAQ